MAEEEQPRGLNGGGAPDDTDGVFFVSMSYKGVSYEVPVQAEDSLGSIFDFVQEALDFPREYCKLISKGKTLRPDNDELLVGEAGLSSGSKVMLVASSAKDVAYVQKSRADPLVKGFAEEERDEASRRKKMRAGGGTAWGTKQDAEYNFGSIKAEFKYSTPPPYDAEKLLQKLATDPGIIEIMKTRQFKVGVLTEMSPAEAADRMSKKGTPNMDLLGYNQNMGGMIVLKLRTDTLKGFRPYHDLINTLIHELTHNVWGPHDNNFWKLFAELKAQYMRFHRFWSHGGRAADSNAAGQFQGFAGQEEDQGGNFGRMLGGPEPGTHLTEAERRSRALAAAEARSRQPEVADESDKDNEADSPDKPVVPNFLAAGGTWLFLCPCGLTHEVDSDDAALLASVGCPIAAKAATAASVNDQSSGSDPQSGAGPERQMPASSDKDHQEAAGEAGQIDTSAAGQAPQEMDQEMDGTVNPRTSVDATSTAIIANEMEVDSGILPIDLADLESQGLDGAAIWLQRFSDSLRSLGRPDQVAARVDAMELLLKLVQNVVNSPQEQKFRRIRADNPKVRAKLMEAGGKAAEELITMLGFEASTESSGERVFILQDASLDTARLRMGQDLLEAELEKTRALASR